MKDTLIDNDLDIVEQDDSENIGKDTLAFNNDRIITILSRDRIFLDNTSDYLYSNTTDVNEVEILFPEVNDEVETLLSDYDLEKFK
jgi:hypothetical protein